MVQAIDEYVRQGLAVPSLDLEASPEARRSLEQMKDQGYTYLPPLDPEWTARMMDYFENQPVYNPCNGAKWGDESMCNFRPCNQVAASLGIDMGVLSILLYTARYRRWSQRI